MPTPLFLCPQVAAAVKRELAPPPFNFRVGARFRRAARALYARPTRANSMKRPLTTYCTPRRKKNSRRSKGGGENARAAALGPLLAARLRQLAGGTQRALLDAAHTQGPPHHCNTMMDMDAIFPMVRARPASSPRKDTLSGPPSSGRRSCASPPLRACMVSFPTACACHVPFFYLHRLLAAPRPPPPMPALLFHRKRHAWLRSDS